MIHKPNTLTTCKLKTGQRRHAIVTHGIPGKPSRAVLRVCKRGVIAEFIDGGYVEVNK